MTDVDRVGGKNASLGELLSQLTSADRGTLDVSSRGEDGLGRARWRAGVL